MAERETFEGWAFLELMGHRKLAGYIREATVGGASMLRIDVPEVIEPGGPDAHATQYYPVQYDARGQPIPPGEERG